jgi:hypothetical protein
MKVEGREEQYKDVRVRCFIAYTPDAPEQSPLVQQVRQTLQADHTARHVIQVIMDPQTSWSLQVQAQLSTLIDLPLRQTWSTLAKPWTAHHHLPCVLAQASSELDMSTKLPADPGRGLQEPQVVVGTLDLNQVSVRAAAVNQLHRKVMSPAYDFSSHLR